MECAKVFWVKAFLESFYLKNKTKHISKECLAHASCDLENPAAQYVEQSMLYFMQVCVTISQQQRRIISQQ